MNKSCKKLLIVGSSLVLISLVFLLKISFLGNKNKATAQTIICEETAMVDGQEQNALEIPIGKAVDQAEYLAEEIAIHAREIINTIPLEIQAVNELSSLAQQCGAANDEGIQIYCEPDCREEEICGTCSCRGCHTDTPRDMRCHYTVCTSNITPDHICCCDNNLSNCSAGSSATCSHTRSCDPETERRNPGICDSQCQECHNEENRSDCCCTIHMECISYHCNNAGGRDRACPVGIPNQVAIISGHNSSILQHQAAIIPLFEQFGEPSDTDRDLVMPKLEESRRKLFDCVVTPGEAAAVLRGDISGKWLVSCDALLSYFIPVHSYLPFRDGAGNIITPEQLEQDCYGHTYCEALEQWDETPPYDYPCANDYYCCFISH